MAQSFIGKTISLISHSDVRYRGVLAGIDPAAATIQLSNVYSLGTEQRRPPTEFIPPVQDPYQYIIFRASEVKDLSVDEAPPPRRDVREDPAVLGASAQPAGYGGYPPNAGQNFQSPVPTQAAAQQQAPPQTRQAPSSQQQQPVAPRAAAPAVVNGAPRNSAAAGAGGNLTSVAASMESVERALGDLRVNGTAGGAGVRGGQRRRQQEIKAGDLRVPTTDFDFEGSNARFDKASLGTGPKKVKSPSPDSEDADADAKTNPSDESEDEEKEKKQKEKEKETEQEAEGAYNPTKSFFDSLSSSTQGQQNQGGMGGRGRGRGAGGRNRREEERERNVATFGEPGGVGLLGPGSYVGGWGGYGRRGGQGSGGRGRRGGYYAGIGGR